MKVVDEIIKHANHLDTLVPQDDMLSRSGKIERIRYALAHFDSPHSCSNVEMKLIPRKEDCEDCSMKFLTVIIDILDNKGLPGE